MSPQIILTLAAIILGGTILVLAMLRARHHLQLLTRSLRRRSWIALTALMVLFVGGYAAAAVTLAANALASFEVIAAIMFLCGGAFVYAVVRIGIASMRELEQRRAHLKRGVAEWRATFDSTSDAILLLDHDRQIVKANRRAARLLGDSAEALASRRIDVAMAEANLELDLQVLDTALERQEQREQEARLGESDVWFSVSAAPVHESERAQGGAVLVLRDISESKRLQREILKANEDWEQTFSTINDAITIQDSNFNVLRANRAAGELLGTKPEAMIQRKCFEAYHGAACPPKGCESCKTAKTGIPVTMETFEPHLQRHIEIKALPRFDKGGKLMGLVHIVRDISERKEAEDSQKSLEEQLLQAQKMESIGRLAGGVAHDFNNMLTAILSYAQMAQMRADKDSKIRRDLDVVVDSAQRAARLTQQLLAFSRKQVLKIQVTSVTLVVEDVTKMLQRIIGEDIELDLRLDSSKNVMADSGQLEQVLLNLSVNARDAMPNGGKLTIETSDVDVRGKDQSGSERIPSGAYVIITVTDTGEGMSDEIKNKVFEPFFTTKEQGKGTGLGLATVYGIVKQHRGYVVIESAPRKGTTFNVYLPVVERRKATDELPRLEKLERGTETILVAEDNTAIREIITSLLPRLGYECIAGATGAETLAAARDHDGPIDLLLTDVVMPGMNGLALAEQVKESFPDIKVVFMSGHTDDIIAKHGVLNHDVELLPKPFTPGALMHRLRSVLDGEPPGRGSSPSIGLDDLTLEQHAS